MDNRWGKDNSKNTFEEDVEWLGQIAMQWRAACSAHKAKQRILCGEAINSFMDDYEQAVNRLIKSGRWFDMPPPEDQLPEDMMPKEFFRFWGV